MKPFTGYEYLLIDIANQAGHDKLRFEDRIEWATNNIKTLEAYDVDTKDKPMYLKAVQTLRKAQAGEATGHMVALDGVCSGIQIMSVLTGCYEGARATGLVDPDRRADAYSQVTAEMQNILSGGFTVSRPDAKKALMTAFYGSKATPKLLFGEDTPEIEAFYKAAYKTAPGAWELLQDLLASWNSGALTHSWKMPDGYDALVRVMVKKDARIEVDELDHASFTYEYEVNEGTKKGLSNAANVIHSVDAYILRSMHRRCNYDYEVVRDADNLILNELIARETKVKSIVPMFGKGHEKFIYYIEQYSRSSVADIVILPYLTQETVVWLSTEHLEALHKIATSMLKYKPFEVVTVHDEFRCHPNNLNHLRQQYINILSELADSSLLDDLLSQVTGRPQHFVKFSPDLSKHIQKSNYALC